MERKPSLHLKEKDVKQPCTEARKESETNAIEPTENSEVSDSSKRRETDHCSLLAVLMGMEEVELNKLYS